MEDAAPPTPPDMTGVTVLQIVPSLDTGGAERTAVDVAAALVTAGGRALVATTGGRMVAELEAAGAEWIDFPAATKNPARIVANAGRLRAIAQAEGVSLIHARSRAPAWSALIAARRTGLPFVTTYHGAYRPGGPLKGLYNSVMARGDAVIANSHFTARRIARHHRVAEGRITVIHRGIDTAAFDPSAVAPGRIAALRGAWGIAEGRRVVLLPARLTSWKGQEVLIDAARMIVEAGDGTVDFVLAGDAQGRDGYRDGLVERVLATGLGTRVRLVGHCADMPAACALADVVAVPSTEPEAFGRTAVEAQAAGRPVVVSALGAAPETVLAPPEADETARTGWRVPAGDAAALAEALVRALALGEADRRALGTRARAHACASFSLEAMTAATLRLYSGLLRPDGA